MLLGFFALIIIHFIVKDRWYITGVLFYAFPLLVIIGIGIVFAILFSKNQLILKSLIVTTILLGMYWWYHSFHFASEVLENNKYQTVLFWNIAKQKDRPLEVILKHVKAENPEFIGLVETEHISDSIFKIYQTQLQNYQLVHLKSDMIFGSKQPIKNVYYESVSDDYAFNHITIGEANNTLEIMLIDLYGSPFHNKKPPFEIIYKYLKKHPIDVILGDFNTPFESVHFRKLESDFTPFHGLNSGFTYTWPNGLPLFELDQIWISKKHQALKLQKLNYAVSDHSMLIGFFKLKNHKQIN